jgi:tetratricopeptide (TPR) repeat protein
MSKSGRRNRQSSKRAGAGEQPAIIKQFEQVLGGIIHLMKIGNLGHEMDKMVGKLSSILERFESDIQARDEALYYQGLCVISEYHSYLGRYEKSLDVVAKGGLIYRELQERMSRPAPLKNEERTLLREQVRYVADYAMARYYRSHDYDEARKIVSFCVGLGRDKLRDKNEFPVAGTLAQLMYFLGRINRQDHNHQEAMVNFDEAVGYFYERGEQKKNQYLDNEEKQKEELDFIRHRTAHCLALGLGWICYTRGQLRQALHFILPARVLLLHTGDPVSIAYTDLMYGTTLRALGITNEETIKLIAGACNTFKRMGHKSYLIRATYELALAYLFTRDQQKAESALDEIDSLLAERPDSRWGCNALVVRSRIEREMKKDYVAAERHASTAYNIADAKHLILCKIDALIARGEARIRRRAFENARKDLEEALDLNHKSDSGRKDEGASPKIEAVCHLHLAHSFALECEGNRARDHFQKWELLHVEVEHSFIHKLAASVEREISSLEEGFFIPPDTMDLNYERWKERLQIFLVKQAKSREQEKEQQRELLGVARPTFLKWEKIVKRGDRPKF